MFATHSWVNQNSNDTGLHQRKDEFNESRAERYQHCNPHARFHSPLNQAFRDFIASLVQCTKRGQCITSVAIRLRQTIWFGNRDRAGGERRYHAQPTSDIAVDRQLSVAVRSLAIRFVGGFGRFAHGLMLPFGDIGPGVPGDANCRFNSVMIPAAILSVVTL